MSAATAQPQQGGKSEHNVFLRVLAHRLTLVQSVQRMWRSEGACPALFYLTELEEPSVTSDVLRCAFAATAAPIKSSPDGEFHFSLPTYPFAVDAEGITSDTVTHAPGVDWVEHLTAALLQMLTSKFVEYVCHAALLWQNYHDIFAVISLWACQAHRSWHRASLRF